MFDESKYVANSIQRAIKKSWWKSNQNINSSLQIERWKNLIMH